MESVTPSAWGNFFSIELRAAVSVRIFVVKVIFPCGYVSNVNAGNISDVESEEGNVATF